MIGSIPIAGPANGNCLVVRFSTADYAPRKRFDAWREIYGRTLQRLDIEPSPGEQFHAEATLRRMPGLAMMAGRRSASIYHRRRELIHHDDIGVTVGLSSSYEAQQFGRTLTMGRGEAVVMTGSEPAFVKVPTLGEYINLRVPLRLMSPLVADLDAAYGRRIPAQSTALQLLTRYIGILEETETFAGADLRRQVVTHIHDLIALAIGATRDATEIAKSSRGARGAVAHDQRRYREPTRPRRPVGGRHRRAASDHAAVCPEVVRKRGHDVYRLRARAAPCPRASITERSAPRRPKDQHRRLRCRLRRSVLFQPHIPSALRRGTIGIARCGKVR